MTRHPRWQRFYGYGISGYFARIGRKRAADLIRATYGERNVRLPRPGRMLYISGDAVPPGPWDRAPDRAQLSNVGGRFELQPFWSA